MAQQLREATPLAVVVEDEVLGVPAEHGPAFARVTQTTGIDLVRTAYRAPKEHAICERFLGSVRRECLHHLLIVSEEHLMRNLSEYAKYFNAARPHQGLHHRGPVPPSKPAASEGPVRAFPLLGHNYERAA